MFERFRNIDSRALRFARNTALASVVAVGGLSGSAPTAEALVTRNISCTDTTRYVPTINQGEVVYLHTRAAVGEGDWKVDGVRQYDDRAETQTLLGFKSADSSAKNWTLTADYSGTLLVLRCAATNAEFYKQFGKIGFNLDKNNGLNSAASTTNMQALQK